MFAGQRKQQTRKPQDMSADSSSTVPGKQTSQTATEGIYSCWGPLEGKEGTFEPLFRGWHNLSKLRHQYPQSTSSHVECNTMNLSSDWTFI